MHPAIAPAPGEVIVTKRRVSAFAGSDLDIMLRDRAGYGAANIRDAVTRFSSRSSSRSAVVR